MTCCFKRCELMRSLCCVLPVRRRRMKFSSDSLGLLFNLILLLSTGCSEFVGKCGDGNSTVSVTLDEVRRYGVCEPYAGLAGPCNSLFRAGVDYIYIPYTRTHGDQHRLSQHMNDTQLSITFIPERCRDVTIKLLCNFYLIPCGNSTVFLPPVSVCSEQCFHLRNDLCPDEWELVLGYLNANQWLVDIGLGFIDCNNAGLMLEPLPYCCTDAGVTLPTSPTSTSTGHTHSSTAGPSTLITAISAGVGGILLMCVLGAVTVVAAVVYARKRIRRRRKKEKKADVPVLQVPPPISPREGISSPSFKYDDLLGVGMLAARNNQYGDGLAPGRSPVARVTSTYLRQMSGKMIIPSHCICLMDCVGQGEFGVVYRAYLSGWEDGTSQVVAVKTLKVMCSPSDLSELLDESLKMKAFSHPNILSLIGVCVDGGPAPYVVMPYMERGSLLHFLKKERPHFTLAEGADSELVVATQCKLLPMCLQIAKGMEYLAGERFVHRDLAARNCMIDSGGVIKVADFGLSEDVYSKNYFRQGTEDAEVRLPIRWMALESLQDSIFSEKTDVWSFGVTCWEIFSLGRMPYPGVDPFSLVKFLEEGKRLEKPSNTACTDEIYSIVLRCWCENADKRPPFSELVTDITTSLEAIAGYMDFSCLSFVDKKEEEEVHPYDHLAEQDT